MQIELWQYALLGIIALGAGFVDSVVGGGGLIQIPALLIQFPKTSLPILFGTNKIAALSGTSVAAYNYSKKIKFNLALLLVCGIFAFSFSYFGAYLLNYYENKNLKPVILCVLIFMFVYTYFKKDLGNSKIAEKPLIKRLLLGSLLCIIVGFYDGFFGPGTGSFLVLGFVSFLGFDFLQASAYSKIINCITNFSALISFVQNKNYILPLAICMAVFNVTGNVMGTHYALKHGNNFIKKVFFIVVGIMILRYSYDIFIA
jgi:uncharacterized protein